MERLHAISSYALYNVSATYSGIKNLTLTAGVKNLLNTDPPSSRTEVNFQTGYDATFTNPLGRTYYVRAKYKFF